MLIGVPKEIKTLEHRVAMTPDGVRELERHGIAVFVETGCTTCHMSDYADGAGGHTFWPAIGSCNACHDDHEDFDRNGYQTEMQGLLDELRDNLIALGVVEWVEADAAYEPVVGTYPTDHARAFFNWIGLEEDRSMGVHNPRYFKALLQNSIEATTPTF